MKTSVLFGASILAMFAANESFAAGYICEESRVYTSCGAGLYLKENDFEGSGVGTCEVCPDGFTDGTGIVGKANCVNNNAPKGQYYSYDEGTGTGTFLPCPAGYYCTGGSLTYDTAVSGGGGGVRSHV